MGLVTVSVQMFGELSCYGKVTHQTGKYSTADVKLSEGSTLKDLLDYLLMCTNERGFTLQKAKSRGRIDGAIALALAVDAVDDPGAGDEGGEGGRVATVARERVRRSRRSSSRVSSTVTGPPVGPRSSARVSAARSSPRSPRPP